MIETGMKDKLRELADEMEACWICASIDEGEITLETINNWSGRLSAILDTEGDGGAVTCQDALIYAGDQYTDKYKDDDRQDIKTDVLNVFYQGANWMRKTNPARSGVVSDEDVTTACRKYYYCGHPVYPPVFEGMRAALEFYERSRK